MKKTKKRSRKERTKKKGEEEEEEGEEEEEEGVRVEDHQHQKVADNHLISTNQDAENNLQHGPVTDRISSHDGIH